MIGLSPEISLVLGIVIALVGVGIYNYFRRNPAEPPPFEPPPPPPPPPAPLAKPHRYFLPGEIAFFVDHDDPSESSIIAELSQRINAAELDASIKAALQTALTGWEEGLTSEAVEKRAAAPAEPLYQPQAEGAPQRPRLVATRFRNPENLEQELYSTTVYATSSLSDDQLFDAVVALNNQEKDPEKPIRFQSASLNWLGGSTPGGGSTVGGPGAIPVPITQTSAIAQIQAQLAQIIAGAASIGPLNWPQHIQELRRQEVAAVDEVEIAILDTVPSLALLLAQHGHFVASKPNGKHPALSDFLGNNPQFSVVRDGDYLIATNNNPIANDLELQISYSLLRHDDSRLLMDFLDDELEGYEIERYPHKMTDHGLFVASVVWNTIKALAPGVKVRIHLIQTLGDYGVGTLASLESGLSWALSKRKGTGIPLVVNCSLIIAPPRQGHEFNLPAAAGNLAAGISRAGILERERAEFGDMLAALQSRASALYNGGVNLVAAAGNEGMPGMPKPAARYPAAFLHVLGVGATTGSGSAQYSNFPDDPLADGTETFGGEARYNPALKLWEIVNNNGVPGVYIGGFPRIGKSRYINTTGWAHWAGTSFAAPQAAAALAALRARGVTAQKAASMIDIRQP